MGAAGLAKKVSVLQLEMEGQEFAGRGVSQAWLWPPVGARLAGWTRRGQGCGGPAVDRRGIVASIVPDTSVKRP
jgi:hypothetical protein